MKNIQFLQDTSKANVPLKYQNENTICIYREGYKLPNIPVQFIEIEKYKNLYMSLNPKCLILIGINRIIKPANRCNLLYEYWQENTNSIPKYSIDTAPFIGEPWRFWYHFSVVNKNNWNYPHSYFVETKWKTWFYREVENNPIILLGCQENVLTDINKLNSSFAFRKAEKFEEKHYLSVKEQAFLLHDTPKAIIFYITKNLKDFVDLDFDHYSKDRKFELPDLPICHFYATENLRRQKFYNEVLGHG